MKFVKWVEHIDKEWIERKINGRGAIYSFNKIDGIIIIHNIYGKNKIQIFWYNSILFIKYLIRKIKKKVK